MLTFSSRLPIKNNSVNATVCYKNNQFAICYKLRGHTRRKLCNVKNTKTNVHISSFCILHNFRLMMTSWITPLTPNDPYSGRAAPLTSKRCILYIYSTNIGTEYFKHGIYSPFFSLQNAVCFIILTYLFPVLFTFYIQVC